MIRHLIGGAISGVQSLRGKILPSDFNAQTYASATDLESATDLTKIVPPAMISRSPYAAKAWVQWTVGGTTIKSQQGVTSISRAGTGDYTVNFSTQFSATNYMAAVSLRMNTGGSSRIPAIGTLATGSCQVIVMDTTGNLAESSAAEIHAVFYGDQ